MGGGQNTQKKVETEGNNSEKVGRNVYYTRSLMNPGSEEKKRREIGEGAIQGGGAGNKSTYGR